MRVQKRVTDSPDKGKADLALRRDPTFSTGVVLKTVEAGMDRETRMRPSGQDGTTL